jgi:amino acid transporter
MEVFVLVVALIGLLLAAAVFAAILAGALKAQTSVKNSGYQSMISYGASTQLLQDKHELHRFGIAQQLRRHLGGMSIFGLSFNVMALVGGAAFLYGPALKEGGPSVIGFGFPILALLALLVSASLAELASAVPTAGGVYHWATAMGGRKWGWRTGAFHAAGQLATLTLLNAACAGLLDAFLSARLHYDPSLLTFWTMVVTLTIAQAAANHWGTRGLKYILAGGVWLQMIAAALIVGGLVWLFWPGSYSPIVLFQFHNAQLSGTVNASAFIGGTLLLQKLFIGMDAASQGAEETIEPRVKVPWAIYLSTAYTYIVGFAMLAFMTLTLTYTAEGNAGAGLFINSALVGWGGAWIIGAIVLLSLWVSGLQTLTVCSRALLSLARDEALPLSKWWTKVSERHQTPASTVWLSASMAVVILAAAQLITATGYIMLLVSFSVICIQTSYAIPIAMKLQQNNQLQAEQRAPWHLGRWSRAVSWIAVIWLVVSAALAAGYLHRWGAIGAALVLLAATTMDFRYEKRRLVSMQSRAKRSRKELLRMEKKFPLQ